MLDDLTTDLNSRHLSAVKEILSAPDSGEYIQFAAGSHVVWAHSHYFCDFDNYKMPSYHKPDASVMQELRDIANKLRIHSVNATQSSNSG